MNEERYSVVFHGTEIAGFDRDKVIIGLSALFKTTPERIHRLFTGSSSVIKQGLSKPEAEKYVNALKKAGADCSLSDHVPAAEPPVEKEVECPKCSHRASGADDPMLTTGECPSCGIIIAKYKPAETESSDMSPAVAKPGPEDGGSEFSFNESTGFLHFATLEYHLETNPAIPSSADKLAAATLPRRGWASVATFLHWMFIYTFLQIPFGILSVLIYDDMRQARETCLGLSAISGMIVSLVLSPLLWRGHTYGQRAMKIFLVSDDKTKIGLSPLQILIRAPLSLLRFAFGISLIVPLAHPHQESIEDIVCHVKQSSTEIKLSRPWNIALKPFVVLIATLLVLNLTNKAFFFVKDKISSDTAGERTVQMQSDDTPRLIRSSLQELRAQSYNYMLSTGHFPYTGEQIRDFVENSFHKAHVIHTYYADGRLKIQEKSRGLEIGIKEDDTWYVISAGGNIKKYQTW